MGLALWLDPSISHDERVRLMSRDQARTRSSVSCFILLEERGSILPITNSSAENLKRGVETEKGIGSCASLIADGRKIINFIVFYGLAQEYLQKFVERIRHRIQVHLGVTFSNNLMESVIAGMNRGSEE